MNDSQALLVVERGPVPSLRFPLTKEQTSIGRSAGNDLVLADSEVSRRHARIVRRADGFAVEDIGSTNGTFVNQQRISHLTLLQDGDILDLGDTIRLRFLDAAAVTITPVPEVETPAQYQKPPDAWPEPFDPRPDPSPASQPAVSSWTDDFVEANLPPVPTVAPQSRGRGWLIGCGLLIALLLICAGTFLFLDAFDQGRLLYCGAFAPFFEVILGPFGFAPLCP
jgi:pSer/pThr/pTyr-binding forkhead associated (FHA) protein